MRFSIVTPVLGKIIVASMPWRSMSSMRAAGIGGVGVVDVVVVVVGSSPRTLLAQAAGPDACELSGAADEPERLAVEGDDAVAVAASCTRKVRSRNSGAM